MAKTAMIVFLSLISPISIYGVYESDHLNNFWYWQPVTSVVYTEYLVEKTIDNGTTWLWIATVPNVPYPTTTIYNISDLDLPPEIPEKIIKFWHKSDKDERYRIRVTPKGGVYLGEPSDMSEELVIRTKPTVPKWLNIWFQKEASTNSKEDNNGTNGD